MRRGSEADARTPYVGPHGVYAWWSRRDQANCPHSVVVMLLVLLACFPCSYVQRMTLGDDQTRCAVSSCCSSLYAARSGCLNSCPIC